MKDESFWEGKRGRYYYKELLKAVLPYKANKALTTKDEYIIIAHELWSIMLSGSAKHERPQPCAKPSQNGVHLSTLRELQMLNICVLPPGPQVHWRLP